MKAVYIEAHGGPGVLTYGDRPEPECGPREALVRVKAAALNRLDLYTREGGSRAAPGVSAAADSGRRLRRRGRRSGQRRHRAGRG